MHHRTDKRGVRNHNAKLDLRKVRYILGSSRSNVALARELGVSPAAVSNIRTGRTWFWIDDVGPRTAPTNSTNDES